MCTSAPVNLLRRLRNRSWIPLRTHTKPLKVDVDLVLVPVTITDPMNRLVTGLDKENSTSTKARICRISAIFQ
jgi:hypothetical protein